MKEIFPWSKKTAVAVDALFYVLRDFNSIVQETKSRHAGHNRKGNNHLVAKQKTSQITDGKHCFSTGNSSVDCP